MEYYHYRFNRSFTHLIRKSLYQCYFFPDLDPMDLWHNTDGAYARSFLKISEMFHFDGVLIPAVGLAPLDQDQVAGYRDEGKRFHTEYSLFHCPGDLSRKPGYTV